MSSKYFRLNIDAMEGYVPGEQPQGGDFIKLNTNENPYPPSPKVLAALRAECAQTARLYPDPMANAVRRAAEKAYGLPLDQILVGNGSDDLLTIIMRSYVDAGEAVAFPMPTYTLYRTLAEIQGARAIEVDFPDDYSLPPALAETGAKVTFLANPNSPSGTQIPPREVESLAKALDGILVVDEAYVDFAAENCLDLAGRLPNVIVLRTFSKSFSLCGVRCGMAFAARNLIAGMVKVKDSYNVNRFAIAAAAAALDDIDHMRANAARIIATRNRLTAALTDLGFTVYPSQSNFLLARVPVGSAAAALYESLKAQRILVRYFPGPRLDDCIRITIGTDEEVDALLADVAKRRP